MNTPPPNWNVKARQALDTHFWLILSLVGNFFLVVLLYIATGPLKETVVPAPVVDSGVLLKTNVVVRHENFTWDAVESTNYTIFIKNLRAIGCPEQTIRDIIVSEVDRIYGRRRLEEVPYPNYQWWRSEPESSVVQTATQKLEEIEAERKSILTSLLGTNWEIKNNALIAADGGITLTGPVLGDLSADAKETVYAIAARTQLKIEAYQQGQRIAGQPDDPMEIVRLRNEGLAQLVSVLTPAQYEEYALRYSPSAQQLREQMRPITVNQDQFRALYEAVNSINSQPIFYYSGIDPSSFRQQQQLHVQEDAIIKSVLGDQLYAAYQIAQDPLYRSARSTVEQLGVPATTAAAIYELTKATQAEMDRISKNNDMTSDEKIEAISQARVEEQQSLETVLGADAFKRWLQTHTSAQ